MRILSGKCICCANHGLSCLITAYRNGFAHTVLFDTGPEAHTFERNTRQLDIDLGIVEAVVLSHGHWDHAGGMLRAVEMIRSNGNNRDLPYYAHPEMFRTRGRQLPDGEIMPMEDVPSIDELTAVGARVVNTREPQNLLDDMFYLSGEIPRVTPFETGLPFHYAKTEKGWELMELRQSTFHVKGKPDVTLDLKFTRHGPVLWEDAATRRALSLRWVGSEPGTAGYMASLTLDRVQSWQQFEEAMTSDLAQDFTRKAGGGETSGDNGDDVGMAYDRHVLTFTSSALVLSSI